MKRLDWGGIAVFDAVGARIPVQAAHGAARSATGAAHMRQAGTMSKSGLRIGIYRACFQARFSVTCIAKVNRNLRLGQRKLDIEKKCAAIGMPQSIFGMHEDAQR